MNDSDWDAHSGHGERERPTSLYELDRGMSITGSVAGASSVWEREFWSPEEGIACYDCNPRIYNVIEMKKGFIEMESDTSELVEGGGLILIQNARASASMSNW